MDYRDSVSGYREESPIFSSYVWEEEAHRESRFSLNTSKFIIIKKVAGSKHPEVINEILRTIDRYIRRNNVERPRVGYSQVENFYMIRIENDDLYEYVRDRTTPEIIHEESGIEVLYFTRLFTPEFENLNIPYFTMRDVEQETPIYLPTYNTRRVTEDNSIFSGVRRLTF